MHISKFTLTANKDDVIFTSEIISVIPLAMEVRKLIINISLSRTAKKSESMTYLNSINFWSFHGFTALHIYHYLLVYIIQKSIVCFIQNKIQIHNYTPHHVKGSFPSNLEKNICPWSWPWIICQTYKVILVSNDNLYF